jgi:hypothetical protein
MAKIVQEDGTEIEAFTAKEVAAQVKAKEDELGKTIAAKDIEVAKLAADKVSLEEQVKNVKPDHPNFKSLKDALKAKEDELTTTKAAIETDKQKREQEARDAEIKRITKGNEELEKKVKQQLSTTLKGMPETTPEEKKAKMVAALKLSADYKTVEAEGIFDAGISGGGAGAPVNESVEKVEFSSREKALGKNLGISDEDYRKYSSRVSKK